MYRPAASPLNLLLVTDEHSAGSVARWAAGLLCRTTAHRVITRPGWRWTRDKASSFNKSLCF